MLPPATACFAARLPRGMRRVTWLLGGWTTLIFLFLYLPIGVLIVYSFNRGVYGGWEGWTGKWYAAFWGQCLLDLRAWLGAGDASGWVTRRANDFIGWAGADAAPQALAAVPPRVRGQVGRLVEGFANSVYVGFFATLISAALGTLGAWVTFCYKHPLRRAVVALSTAPMVVPEIIMGVSFLALVTFAGALLAKIGVVFERGYLAIILAHATFSFPFVMVTIQARLAGFDPALEEAAMDLGATPAVAFRKVIVPYLWPAIVSGVLMAFTLSLDDFIVTYFVSTGKTETLPIRIYGQLKYSPPMLHVVSTLMVGLTVLLIVGAEAFKRLRR